MRTFRHRLLFTLICALLFAGCLGQIPVSAMKSAPPSSKAGKVLYKNTLRRIKGKYYYYDSRGRRVKSCWKTIKGKRYYFRKNYAAAMGWFTLKGKRYHFTSSGVLQKGWYKSGSKTYYLSRSTGAMYKGWHTIGRKKYYFNSSGVMVKNSWVGDRYLGKDGAYDPSKKKPLARLQSKLKSAIKSYRGTWSVYVKNLNTNEAFSINNQKMYAASLIKLYAMGAAYDRIQQNRFRESSVRSTLRSMITVSSNEAFNTIVRKVGTSYINSWCRKKGYTGTNQGHGLPRTAAPYDLNNGSGSNVTSVKDCGRFLESIYRGTCVSKSASKKMLSLLKQQTRRTKIPAGVPSWVTVANKTGETDDYTHDAAIVYSKGATYILVVMAKTPGTGWSSAKNVTALSQIVYQYFN